MIDDVMTTAISIFWDIYKWLILLAIAGMFVGAALIVGLLIFIKIMFF